MKASVTSDRAALFTTSRPADTRKNASAACDPHWPGDTHARSVVSSRTTRARLVGLKTCLPRTRMTNFEPTATTEAAAASTSVSVRSNRQSESAEMRALLAPDARLRPVYQSAMAWTASAVPTVIMACSTVKSKSRRVSPKINRVASVAICPWRGSAASNRQTPPTSGMSVPPLPRRSRGAATAGSLKRTNAPRFLAGLEIPCVVSGFRLR